MRPPRSASTCSARVGLGRPDRLADGAATGTPAFWMSIRAVRSAGMRTATVSSPPVTSSGTISLRCAISVKGPGQNVSISCWARRGIRRQRRRTSLFFPTCRMDGLSLGRPLAA